MERIKPIPNRLQQQLEEAIKVFSRRKDWTDFLIGGIHYPMHTNRNRDLTKND